MNKVTLALVLDSIIDQLAEIEHDRWAHWQRYMHEMGERQPDGSLLLPAALISKWDRQIERSYTALTETEKESDRDQVRKYLPTIVEALPEY